MSLEEARKKYAALGVDIDKAIAKLKTVPVALHCWQGDDVRGFDTDPSKPLTGGIQTTGSYPGRARNPQELMEDIDQAAALAPGRMKLNLHAGRVGGPGPAGAQTLCQMGGLLPGERHGLRL